MVVSIIAIMATNAKVVFGQRLVVITIVAPRFFRRDIIVGLLVATADDNGTPENGFLFPAGRKGSYVLYHIGIVTQIQQSLWLLLSIWCTVDQYNINT